MAATRDMENKEASWPSNRLFLNLGAGKNALQGYVSVDFYGNPDVKHDLNKAPYPWPDNSVDGIQMWHTLEHLSDWWTAFTECARILKPGGRLHIRVPDASSDSAMTYRDHLKVFDLRSFHGIGGRDSGTNAWAASVENSVPLKLIQYNRVPFKQYGWMVTWCPWLLKFCADHMRNFIWEQRFEFVKIGDRK